MRFFALLLAAASVQGASHEGGGCDGPCVGAIYAKIAEAEAADLGYVEGDMAVYGYILYHSYVGAIAAGAPGTAGFAFVDNALTVWAQACEITGVPTKAQMTTCITGATQEDVDEVKAWLDADQPDGAGDDKPYYEGIIGAISNQLAPGSIAAGAWTGLTGDEYVTALKVYYILGTYMEWAIPTVIAAFPVLSDGTDVTDMGMTFSAKAKTCFDRVGTAIGATGAAGEDLAALIATNGEKAFGTDGLLHADCLASADIDFTGGFKVTLDGTEVSFADADALAAAATKAETDASATVAKLETAGQPGAESEPDASPAAALSAVIAAIALML